jgi:hypothetical protein
METAIASACPVIISDTTLENSICDFTSGSSVTVANGGIVGGINMPNYTPTPPSSIAIQSGGVIDGATSTAIGIRINNSVLSHGLTNQGTISVTTGAGIQVSNASAISGGITNSGQINTNTYSISVRSSVINNGIFNSGSITTIGGTAILLDDAGTVNGGMSNSGTIQVGNNFNGIAIVNNAILNGDFTNSGLIDATVDSNAFTMTGSSTIQGGITNSGIIRSNTGYGVSLNIATLQDNIVNTGTILSESANALAVHNASTVGGAIRNSGTLSGGNQGLALYSQTLIGGGIVNTGTITGDAIGMRVSNSITINGGISNSGTISSNATGISISSSATVSGGISHSGTIQGSTFALNISNSTVPTLDILGKNARIIGAVEAPNTTVNITEGATFTSEGSYHVDLFNIAANALFNIAGNITTSTFSNAGILAIVDPVQTIIGDYVQQTSGLFLSEIGNASDYGQVVVTGNVDLSQSGDLYVAITPNSSIHAGETFSNILSGNTLTPPTDGLQVSDNSFIWTFAPSLNNTDNGINVTASINPTVYQICRGAFCQGVLNTILEQIAAGNSLFSPYATLTSASALQDAAIQATPELTNENIQAIQLITRAVMDVVPMWNNLHGKSAGDAFIYQPGKVWLKPYGAAMNQNAKNTVSGFNATAYGGVIGKDMQWDDTWLVGGAFAAGGDNMHGKSALNGQSIRSTAYQIMGYASKKLPEHFYIAGQGLVGYDNNHSSRSMPLFTSTATGSFNSWFTNLRAEAGWSTYALSPHFVFTPEVDISYLFINQSSYQESGSPMDLSVASNNNSSLVLGAYGNGAYHLLTMKNQNDLSVTGYAGLAGDVLNNQPQTLSTFVAGGGSFTTFGVQFNNVVFRGGAGLSLSNPDKPLIVELNYDAQVGNNAYSAIGAATLKYRG